MEHSAEAPELVERAKKVAKGAAYYHGAACSRCSETLRYALTRGCVRCARRKSQAKTAAKREARRQAGLEALKRVGLR